MKVDEEVNLTKPSTLPLDQASTSSLAATQSAPAAVQCKTPRNDNEKSLKDIRNFKLLAKIGEGAYGTVWRAIHISTQKLYAIKVI